MKRFLKKILPRDYFIWMKYVLMIHGLRPPHNKYFKILYYIIFSPHLFLITFYFVTVECVQLWILYKNGQIKQNLFGVSLMSVHFLAAIRIYNWIFFLSKKISLVVDLVRKELDFRIFNLSDDDILIQNIFNVLSYQEIKSVWMRKTEFIRRIKNYNQRNEIDVFREQEFWATNLKCISIQFFYIWSLGFVFYVCFSQEQPTYLAFNPFKNKTSLYKEYAFTTYFPFDHSVSDGNYPLSIVNQAYMYVTCAILNIDCVNILLLIRTKLGVVKFAISKVDQNIIASKIEAKLLIREIRIVKCIEETLGVFSRALDLMESFYNLIHLLQYLIFSMVLCFMLYALQIATTTGEIIYVLGIIILALIEPLIISWIGQMLIEESYTLLPAIYDLNWLYYPPKLRRKLIFMMMALKKPKLLTLGGLVVISIGFYANFVQKAYSAYTLISKTQNKLN